MEQNPNLFLSVGKQVKDEYGRIIGRVASFALTPSGKFNAVFIEQGDGKFWKHSVETLRFDGPEVMFISKIKSETDALCDQIPLIWRKDQALKDLVEKRKISPELYEELHTSFDGALNQLKGEAKGIVDEVDKEISRCSEETKSLNYALVHLEIEHEIGKIDDQSYEAAFTVIQENLKRVHVEKADFELTKSKISNMLLGDTPKTMEPTSTSTTEFSKASEPVSVETELPEPPVVVYVKEIGKAGI